MLVELLATVQYCFGDDKNTATYDRLLESSSTWMMTNPSSFTPVMIRRRQGGEVFPDIWLLNDCVAAGLQYFHLARILLVVHDPRVPRLCRAGQEASRWIDVSVSAANISFLGIETAADVDDVIGPNQERPRDYLWNRRFHQRYQPNAHVRSVKHLLIEYYPNSLERHVWPFP